MEGEGGTGLQQLVQNAVRAELGDLFNELRRFVDRRIAELSAEIHATVEMVDFSETNLTRELQRMHQKLARVVALPAAATRNSGVELEAVVTSTEEAANRILGAAEAIRDAVGQPDAASRIPALVNTIFEACAFQDLTSQRIRRAVDQLRALDRMLEHMAERAPEDGEGRAPQDTIRLTVEIPGTAAELAQDEIDKLMASR